MDGLLDDVNGRDLAKHLGCTDFTETPAGQPIDVDELSTRSSARPGNPSRGRLSRMDFERGRHVTRSLNRSGRIPAQLDTQVGRDPLDAVADASFPNPNSSVTKSYTRTLSLRLAAVCV
jgi:hypothetical protein